MRIETLVVTIDQADFSLIKKMNIQTEAIIGNQCDRHSREEFEFNGNRIIYMNSKERGVGKNRNLILKNATADICVFADDDMQFVDGYPAIVASAFSKCPAADVLIFNLIEKKVRRPVTKKISRVHWFNYARYGAARIAIRRESIQSLGICFNLSFGGGAKYGSGEDTIFLRDCLKEGLKIYAVPYALAEIDQESASTWFEGYNEKFFRDKGALYLCLHPVLWPVYFVRYIIRHQINNKNAVSVFRAMRLMTEGAREYKYGRSNRGF